MTPHLGYLAHLPVRAVLDGELVALDENGRPDLPLICECLLQRQFHDSPTFMVFDVLSLEGESVSALPYSHRRALLEELRIDSPQCRTPENFDDGAALWEAVCEHELEGVVAKKRTGRYLPGERGWVKIKNRDCWRWELEREGALKMRRERQFV
jgi:bifunctional non-homologous end joining protein LigD